MEGRGGAYASVQGNGRGSSWYGGGGDGVVVEMWGAKGLVDVERVLGRICPRILPTNTWTRLGEI